MENLRSNEEKMIKGIRNLFILNKEQIDTAIKDISNLFRRKKGIKDIVLRNVKILFEYEKEEENCYIYIPARVNNFRVTKTEKLNTNVKMIKIGYYQLKNILIKLDHV